MLGTRRPLSAGFLQVQMERQELVRDLNISYRDVRILDPLISAPYPTALLIREKALVCNFEAVRMIITANECYVSTFLSNASPRPHAPKCTNFRGMNAP